MNKVSKFKCWIVSLSIISILCLVIGCTAYYFLEQNRLIKEAYPYPSLYDAVKKECPSLIGENRYENKTTRDNGLSVSGLTSFDYQGKEQWVEVLIIKENIGVYFGAKNNEGSIDAVFTVLYNTKSNQFYSSPAKIPNPDSTLKKAFEKEMIERLKSC